ncbi:MAG: hypothetical protein V4730_08665 [Pseudomonadota bacterium]
MPVLRIFSLTLLATVLIACGDTKSSSTNANSTPRTDEAGRPVAIAGNSQTVKEAEPITLQGQARAGTGQSVLRVLWKQLDSDNIKASLPTDVGQESIQFVAPQVEHDTVLTFIFRVEDNLGQVSEDKTTVMVRNVLPNRLPIANAGADQAVSHDTASVTLDGCRSVDPDGEISRFVWRSLATTPATVLGEGCRLTTPLSNSSAAEVVRVFELTVTDNEGAEDRAQTRVTQRAASTNTAPVIERTQANPNPGRPSEPVALLAKASDTDGNGLAFAWTQTAGEKVFLADANTATPSFTAPTSASTLSFQVTVSDGVASVTESLSVPIAAQDSYQEPSISECLAAPTRIGCFTALKQQVPENNATPSLGLSAGKDSAGACNPAGRTDWPHFTGMLHEHTAYSDGYQLTKPADVFTNAKAKGWSFAFSTDHSDNMGLPVPVTAAKDPEFCTTNPLACVLSDPENPLSNFSKWEAIQTQALQASTPNFTAVRGFEWTSDRFGHANVLMSQNYVNPKTGPGYVVSMEGFWAWFVTPANRGGGGDGLMVFNHPGREDSIHGPLTDLKEALAPLGLASVAGQSPLPSNPVQDLLTAPGDPAYTFNDFRYVPAADYRVVGIEVFGKGDEYDSKGKLQSWFGYALDKGWYLAPTGSEDHHDTRWGDEDLPKTVIIARTQSQHDLREALLARRNYAVAQNYNHLLLSFTASDSEIASNRYPMGSRLAMPTNEIRFQVSVSTRAGKKTPLLPQNSVIEVISSLANNSNGYTPLVTAAGVSTSFTLPNDTRQHWAFVRIRDKATGRPVAVSAPIWFKRASSSLPVCNNAR